MTAPVDLPTIGIESLLDQDVLDRMRRQATAAPADGERIPIAEVAERTGVSAHTLRYYERIGLIEVARDASGRRIYDADAFARVVFLNRLRLTGMSIRDLLRYVQLVGQGEQTVAERLALLQHHRDQIAAQLAQMQMALDVINYKIAVYGGHCEP